MKVMIVFIAMVLFQWGTPLYSAAEETSAEDAVEEASSKFKIDVDMTVWDKEGKKIGEDDVLVELQDPKGNASVKVGGYQLSLKTYPGTHGTQLLIYSLVSDEGEFICGGTDYLPEKLSNFISLHFDANDPELGTYIGVDLHGSDFWKGIGPNATRIYPKTYAEGKPLDFDFKIMDDKGNIVEKIMDSPLNLKETPLKDPPRLDSGQKPDIRTLGIYTIKVNAQPNGIKGTYTFQLSVRDKNDENVQYVSKVVRHLKNVIFLAGSVSSQEGVAMNYTMRNTEFWKMVAEEKEDFN